MPPQASLTLDTAATFTIRLKGYLDQQWADSLGDVSIRVQSQPNALPASTVVGKFQDQAALAGALNFLYDPGVPLLSLECIDVEPSRFA